MEYMGLCAQPTWDNESSIFQLSFAGIVVVHAFVAC